MNLLARINSRLDDIEAGPAVIGTAVFLAAFIASLIWRSQSLPFIGLAALLYAELAYREARTARAEMAKNVNGIHQAGMDSKRALGALKGLEAAAEKRYLPSTGKHGEAA